MPTLYYEDLEVGRATELGSHTVTEAEIVEFAERFDPLPFHTDPEAAAGTPHGGLIASGYHTLCLANRIVVTEFRRNVASVAGLGIDDLRWPNPVRPGDRLTVTHRVTEKRPSNSAPETGIVRSAVTVDDQDDDTVLSYETPGIVQRRP